jgi:hypothetical protein
MASSFPAYVIRNEDAGSLVEEYTPGTAAGETTSPGEFVTWDNANNWVERCGADPTAILGLAEVDSEQARVLTQSGKIPIRVLNSNAIIAISSSTTPVVATHVGNEYGITRNATTGFWQLDIGKTGGSARALVVGCQTGSDLSGVGEAFFVRMLAEFLSDDGIDT